MRRRIYEESGMEVRFAIGEVPKDYKRQIAEEERKFGAFLHIPVKVRGCAQTRSAERGDACADLALARPAVAPAHS